MPVSIKRWGPKGPEENKRKGFYSTIYRNLGNFIMVAVAGDNPSPMPTVAIFPTGWRRGPGPGSGMGLVPLIPS